jgi:acetamidase/formamidase
MGRKWVASTPLLAEEFAQPYIRHVDLTNRSTAALRDDIQIAIQPFCGTMGVATDEGAADLKISQIVDVPNWGVSAYLSLAVFGRSQQG